MTERALTRWLLACGVIGPVLFVVTFGIAGAIRPGYDPMRVFVSQLSLGDQGWLQIANFVVSGLLILAFAFGLRRLVSSGRASRWGPILVGLVGLGMVVSGVFVTDPALGYPPGAPPGLTQNPSWHGVLHLVGAFFVFGGLPAAAFVFARRFGAEADRPWMIYSTASAVGLLLFYFAATVAASSAGSLNSVAGLLQRVSIGIGFAWIALLAARLMRTGAAIPQAGARPGRHPDRHRG
jgi:Protein of unknown function (DUF998)